MAAKKKKDVSGGSSIAVNRQATFDYFIEERYEAGLALMGWEVKSLRDGRAQLKESYVVLKNGEAWLLGAHISPLTSASTTVEAIVPTYLYLYRKGGQYAPLPEGAL